ncbi:MAG: glycosyltransferase family 9 protein [Arenicellales bacterium]
MIRTPAAAADTVRHDIGRRRRVKLWVRDRRHALRAALSTWLARGRGTPEPRHEPLAEAPATILICRINKRLGNTLFITPLIRSLATRFPGASIDVLVLDPAHRRLLAGLPGVRDILHVPRGALGWLSFIRSFRRRRYDLAIDPSLNAVSNRIAISLCAARYKLGFAGPEQWVRLTHAAAIVPEEHHQARQALHLLRAGIPGADADIGDHLEVRPDDSAREAASAALARARGGPKAGLEIGFFTSATGEKKLPPAWWRQWTDTVLAADDAPRLLQVVPPGSPDPPLPGIATVSFRELDRLAALIGLLDLFVAADSGPMHLAAAAGTPTIGLFRATDPAHYAPLGRRCLSLEPDSLTPDEVAEHTLRHLRELADEEGRDS